MSSEWDQNDPEPGGTIVGFTPVAKPPAAPQNPADESGQTVIGLRRLPLPPAGAAPQRPSAPLGPTGAAGLGARISPNFGNMAMPAPAPAAPEGGGTMVGIGRVAIPASAPAAPEAGGTMVGMGRVAIPHPSASFDAPEAGGTMVGMGRVAIPPPAASFDAPEAGGTMVGMGRVPMPQNPASFGAPEAGGTMVGVARINAPGFGTPPPQQDIPEAGGTMVGVARINAPGFGAPPLQQDIPEAGGTMVGVARINAPGFGAPPPQQDIPEAGGTMVGISPAAFRAPTPVIRPSGPPPSYEILKHLGGGDLGQVFHARHRENGAEVALRIIRPELAAVAGAVDAARDVVALAQGANHTHLGQLFQLDETASPTFVVEYVPGRLLSSIMQERGLAPTGAVIDLGVRMCSALAAAHAVGLAHGRVHAGNIILEAKTGRWVLVDLGHGYVAQALEPSHDLYALAAMLYEMATGHAPFESSDTAPDPRSFVPSVPPTLAALLMRALASDPSVWFPSALEFAQALSRARAQVTPPPAG